MDAIISLLMSLEDPRVDAPSPKPSFLLVIPRNQLELTRSLNQRFSLISILNGENNDSILKSFSTSIQQVACAFPISHHIPPSCLHVLSF